jgi:hypothetical protein
LLIIGGIRSFSKVNSLLPADTESSSSQRTSPIVPPFANTATGAWMARVPSPIRVFAAVTCAVSP